MVRLVLTLLIALACTPARVGSAEVVNVGTYPFLPFVTKSGGLTADLVQAMNAFQKDYAFRLVSTSANRRYRDMYNGSFHLMFFENIKWGWNPKMVDASKVFLHGDGEVYVARSAPGRGQEYFKALEDKHLLGVVGYHYGFANFESDPAKWTQKFRVTFSGDNEISLLHLLAERGDVAVITKSYLTNYLVTNPQAVPKLLVSDRFDQVYAHTVLVKKGSKPSVQDVELLLDKMQAAGVLKKLWSQYGLEK
jgi:hypothetical protein